MSALMCDRVVPPPEVVRVADRRAREVLHDWGISTPHDMMRLLRSVYLQGIVDAAQAIQADPSPWSITVTP